MTLRVSTRFVHIIWRASLAGAGSPEIETNTALYANEPSITQVLIIGFAFRALCPDNPPRLQTTGFRSADTVSGQHQLAEEQSLIPHCAIWFFNPVIRSTDGGKSKFFASNI
jgi:hypothetical protein